MRPHNRLKQTYIRSQVITKDLLSYLRLECDLTSNAIAKLITEHLKIKTDATAIIGRCKELGIKTLTIKESRVNSTRVSQQTQTCLDKYGATNPLGKGTAPYTQRNRTVLETYGVQNVFQAEEIKLKAKQTLFEKWGVTSSRHLKTRSRFTRKSKIHKKVEELLKSLDIYYESEVIGKFTKHNDYLGRLYSPQVDILLETHKIVLEINGDYWHANPKMYKKTDQIELYRGRTLAEEIWNHDAARRKQIEGFGYKVIELWECDIKSNFEYIKSLIEHETSKNKEY